MKNYKSMISAVLISLLIVIIFAFTSGYRISVDSAAKVGADLKENSKLLLKEDLNWGKIYLYQEDEDYKTVISVLEGVFWKAPLMMTTNDINDKKDTIRTIGAMSFGKDERKAVTYLVVKNMDEEVSYVEGGVEGKVIKKAIELNSYETFIWDRIYYADELNLTAYSKEGKALYRYGYPEGEEKKIEEFKWHKIK